MDNGEWQMAGKAKISKPKPKQQPSSVETNHMNGYAAGNSAYKRTDNSQSYGQNGMTYNGGNSRRGGRLSAGSGYGGRSNHTTNSAQYSRPTSSKEGALSKRKLLEKEAKNITKRDAAIEHVGSVFGEEIEKSRDGIRQAFKQMRDQLNERERLMLEELDRCKKEGSEMLLQQEKRSKELKEGASNAAKLNDRQMDDLRSQIRRFMGDRRFEDDLCKPMRFQCDVDRMIDGINAFGEVIPIGSGGCAGEQQKHSSMSSLVSSGDGDGGQMGVGQKAVSEINIGGIVMKSNSMDVDQLAELTRSLRENLKLQGIAEDILPEVCGSIGGGVPARRRPPPRRMDRNHAGDGDGRP